jgi:outer membrane protein assembly factor BamE (lipoprotein component of BamABCDE complex)
VKSPKVLRIALLLAVLTPSATLLSGCPAGVYGNVVKPEQIAAIQRGSTSKARLIDMLGSPDRAVDLGDGREEFWYIKRTVANHSSWLYSTKSGFWVVFNHNIVEAYGERNTVKDDNSHWSFF